MPKRSNDFQELVAMVHRALAPSGARITESALVDVPGIEEVREVDVLIEGRYGPFNMRIAIEVKDHKRKMDLIQYEAIAAKYRLEGGVKVDKLVIVTHSGFYAPTIQRAKAHGVELYRLSRAKRVRWQQLGTKIRTGTVSSTLNVEAAPHFCGVRIDPAINGINSRELLHNSTLVCACCKKDWGSLSTFCSKMFNNWRKMRPDSEAKLIASAKSSQTGEARTVYGRTVRGILQFQGDEFPLRSITIVIHAASATRKAECETLELTTPDGDETLFHHFQASAVGKKFSLLVPQDPKQRRSKAVLKIQNASPTEAPIDRGSSPSKESKTSGS
ncbi:hypothetical protein [Lacipirellula sp.]|uniref:hypothetical protein n=1 Tax=Lacipirellula sp. TaxID=2691419 RepID=UPI003D0E7EA4